MNGASGAAQREISIPSGVPALLRDLVHERTGLYFESNRLDLLIDKLRPRVEANRCPSYLDYYYLLKYERTGRQEWNRVMDAFSVQETYFWRELPHVRALVDHLVPAWFRRHERPLRIWSAACASGEEPYTIAIALREAGWADHPISIEASDASEAALDQARRAVYRERSFRALPPDLRAKYFDSPSPLGSRLRRELLPPISLCRANLVEPAEIAPLAGASVVFCRNVFIYFSPEAIRRTVARIALAMPSGGHLFVGASESLLRLTQDFGLRQIGEAFAYEREAVP
ncbi:MAG: CheR family methyltransferase [Opitutaceae bacterium]